MKKSQTNITVPQDDNNQITFLPSEKIVSAESISIARKQIKEQVLNLKQFCDSIVFLDSLNYIGEIIQFGVNYVTAIKQPQEKAENGKIIEDMMGKLLWKFDHSEYSNHKLFRDYKIIKTKDPKKFIYTIPSLDRNGIMRECTLKGEKSEISDKFEKIRAMQNVLTASIMNNNINNTASVIKDLFENSKEILTSILTENQKNYQAALLIINMAIQYIEPKFQLKPVKFLKEHLKENFLSLTHASKVLLDNKYFEEAIELLEPKLINVSLTSEAISQSMYNLGLSYLAIWDYTKAEQYFLNSSAGLPKDDLDLIINLFSIYSTTNRIEKAKELLTNISSEHVKNCLALSLNTREITKEKLASINKKVLPDYLLQRYKYYEYIARYNSYSNSEREKKQQQLSTEFKKIITSTDIGTESILSIALYTKQNQIALDLLKEIPENLFNTFPVLIKLKALLDPTSILSLQEKYNIDKETSTFIFDIACHSLIIENRHKLLTEIEIQKKNGEFISNELWFEAMFVVSLLEGSKEKAKEYAEQLSEEKQEEIITNFSSNDEQIDSLEQLIEQCDAKKIHEYYQTKKKHDLLLLEQEFTKTPVGYWKFKNGAIITAEKAKFIGQFKGKNCYGVISEKLEDKVGSSKFDIFKKTLEEKGLVYRKFGQNGVKFLKKAFEVKIDDDERVYTNEVFKNNEGELLLNFDHNGDHEDLKNFVIGHILESHDFF